MQDSWETFWNQRYQETGYAYGSLPNDYLANELKKIPTGKILFPAEGEGRNAVYAAQSGWQVDAFDISQSGQKKALQWAMENEVSIQYQVGELKDIHYPNHSFDAIGLIYAHFPTEQKSNIHEKLLSLLRPGGHIILEAFSKNHLHYQSLNPQVGGPKELGMLHSIEEMRRDFNGCIFLELKEQEITLNEGKYHQGLGSVLRMVAIKKES
jgi:2-polyprenyl-3-methyl-5-hydroxy-6-metoxy-1,4-benzoquinol methylase